MDEKNTNVIAIAPIVVIVVVAPIRVVNRKASFLEKHFHLNLLDIGVC
jgi:hypothetical protein